MSLKGFAVTMGIGAAAGAVAIMMMPRSNPARNQYAKTTTITQFPGRDLSIGSKDPIKQEVVR